MKRLSAFLLIIMVFTILSSCKTTNNASYTEIQGYNDICDEHRYSDGVCKECNCVLWNGQADISWYNEREDRFNISKAEQLAGLAFLVNEMRVTFDGITLTLTRHIDLNGMTWTAIGGNKLFAGVFDGNGYSISNFFITNSSSDKYYGFFGNLTGTVKNLLLCNFDTDTSGGDAYVGGLVSYNQGTVDGCAVIGSLNHSSGVSAFVGGIVGRNDGRMTDCVSAVTVVVSETSSEKSALGGLVGYNYGGEISRCCAYGSVRGLTNQISAGGLVGACDNYSSSLPSGVPTNSSIDGMQQLGLPTGKIENCYANADIIAVGEACSVGGLIGSIVNRVQIDNCYFTGEISIDATNVKAGGLIGGEPISTSLVLIQGCVTDCMFTLSEDVDVYTVASCVNASSLSRCYYSDRVFLSGANMVNGILSSDGICDADLYRSRVKWDESVWDLRDGSYPTLRMERNASDSSQD